MSTANVIPFMTERAAARLAIRAIQDGAPEDAARLLRQTLVFGQPAEDRAGTIVLARLRAGLERAYVELTHPRGGARYALATLRCALKRPPPP